MRYRLDRQEVTLLLEGTIDSGNAQQTEAGMRDILAQHAGKTLRLDAENLEYISSAGLRMLLRLTKERKEKIPLGNVSPAVYDILQMTGFDKIFDVQRQLRKISVEGCPVIGKGAVGTVYRLDEDTIVKVYTLPDSLPMIENEQKRAKQAFLKGIPTAISYDVVKVGEYYGSVFEMLKANTLNDWIVQHPEQLDAAVARFAEVLRQIHAVEMNAGELPDARQVFLGYVEELKPILGESLFGRLRALFSVMPENLHAIHGDVHMKNIMLSNGEPLLIDMDTLSVGDPVFDLQSLYVAYRFFNEDEPRNSEAFLGLTDAQCDRIWKGIMAGYFQGPDSSRARRNEARIRIVACVRFLQLLHLLGVGAPELKEIRTEHTLKHLSEWIGEVDSLPLEL